MLEAQHAAKPDELRNALMAEFRPRAAAGTPFQRILAAAQLQSAEKGSA